MTASAARLATFATTLCLTGCASFVTIQTDTSYENGKPLRSITTKAKARTFFDAKSQLATFKASQTDKTQSAQVGGLTSETSGTNAVQVLDKLLLLVQSLPR